MGPAKFDPARAFAHVEALADGIGSRPAGSSEELAAAKYLRDQLQGFGYEAELQPFSFDVFSDAGSSLQVTSPRSSRPAVYPFKGSADGVAEGQLVDAGIGQPDDFPAGTPGKIALIKRGTLYFSDKAANAAEAGAAAAIIYNDKAGLFSGELSKPSEIPVLSISQEDGEALLAMMKDGAVSVRLEVRTRSGPRDSQNVVARPPDGECRVIAGGHYDSVPAGPGANDNASGTATAVEMARVLAADGEFDDACFVLFGSEEVGLIGSARFVDKLTAAQKDGLEGVLNFDMVGTGGQWFLAGLAALTDVAKGEAERRGLKYTARSTSPEDVGSDHASFLNAGIPAIFIHRYTRTLADDPHYHTAEDKSKYVQATLMAEAGEMGLGMIEELLASP
ncbi:MAG: M28 family metallopeptidase [Dehalococcoidia bacterium]|nr:M28 family metallopeptidase [Dehalococcoidia bacterium]